MTPYAFPAFSGIDKTEKKWGQVLPSENRDIETGPIIDKLWRRNA
jgi:hypothetical protein